MGNQGGIGNAEATWGASSDDFGKNLVKNIKSSVKKRNDQTPTTKMYGNDWEVVQDMGAKPRSIQEMAMFENEKSKKNKLSELWGYDDEKLTEDANTDLELKSVAKQIFSVLKKYGLNPTYEADGRQFQSKAPQTGYGARIVLTNDGVLVVAVYDRGILQTIQRAQPQQPVQELDMGNTSISDTDRQKITQKAAQIYKDIVSTLGQDKFEFKSNSKPSEYGEYLIYIRKKNEQQSPTTQNNNNNTQIKESMKRLKFKNEFKGLGNALKLIPEAYKVDNKTFEMTDGNETYKIRWEGNLSEGKAVVLTAADKKLVNEDITRMKELFGYKSHETLGLVKGNARIDENKAFTDIWNKTRALMTESEDIESTNADEGYWEEETKSASEATKHIQGSTSKDKGTQAPKAKEGDLDDAVSHASEAKKHVEGSVSTDKGTQAPKPKEGHWEDAGVTQAAEAKKHVHLKESEEIEEAEMEAEGYDIMKEEPMDVTEMMDKMMKEEEEMMEEEDKPEKPIDYTMGKGSGKGSNQLPNPPKEIILKDK